MAEENNLTWMQRFAVSIVNQGDVPKHMACIMDGNRRYARARNLPLIEGHNDGYKKMLEVQEWSRAMGIYAITAYAFSIENFKRTKEEVDQLMNLFEKAFQDILDDIDIWIKRDTQIRVIGRLELFPKRLQIQAGQIMEKLSGCKMHVFTLACPYTSRDDMISAIHQLMEGVDKGLIEPEDVSEGLMEKCLQTRDLPPVDMLVRTSGEMRFSDFMLWQSTYSFVCFEKVTWPQYGFWNFLGGILLFQRHSYFLKDKLKRTQVELEQEKSDPEKGTRITNFLGKLDRKHIEYVAHLSQ